MKSFQKTTLVTAMAILVIIAGIFLGVINPLASRFLKIYQKNIDLNNELSALEKKHDYLVKMDKHNTEIDQANQKFSDFVPKTSQVEDALVQLDALAKKSTNTLPTFSVQEDKATQNKSKEGIKTTSISIVLSGTYESVRTFIDSLEKLQRFTVIDSVTLSTAEGAVTANIKLTIYHNE